jgi:nucleoside-diphosphate-sugar epimerase
MKSVLVTGATGFIGQHALEPLVERGFHVHAVSSKRVVPRVSAVAWHTVDLFEPDSVRALLDTVRPSHLLHFAWSMVPGGSAPAEENLRWVNATLDLARSFAASGGERAVMAGSCAEYDWRYGYCDEQLTPLAPRTHYGVCKNAVRAVCDAYFADSGISFGWGRIFFVYGPHEPLPRLVPSIVSSLKKQQPAKCTHGEQMRDYLHVEDVAGACVALLDTDVRGPVNIASGQPVTLRDIAEHIARRLNAEPLLRMGAVPAAPDDPPMLVADVRRLANDVGWKPRHSLQSGLDHTIGWWMNTSNKAVAVGGSR